MEKKISVIVPVYNVEQYLERCVNSIINQTYENLEIILVDDGSTDRSGGMCDSFAEKDERIKVVHKENGGLSSARNSGIDIATGEYLAFVDSDDWIESCMYQVLMDLAENHHADIVECKFQSVIHEKEEIIQPDLEVVVLDKFEGAKAFFDGTGQTSILAWNKIYNKQLFQNLRFPNGLLNEDQWLIPKLYMLSEKIVCVNQKYYYYYQSPNSIMRSPFSFRRLDALKAFEETRRLYERKHLYDLVQWCDVTYSFLLIKYYNQSKTLKGKPDVCKKIKKYYNKRMKDFLKNKHLNWKQKILLILYYVIPGIYKE